MVLSYLHQTSTSKPLLSRTTLCFLLLCMYIWSTQLFSLFEGGESSKRRKCMKSLFQPIVNAGVSSFLSLLWLLLFPFSFSLLFFPHHFFYLNFSPLLSLSLSLIFLSSLVFFFLPSLSPTDITVSPPLFTLSDSTSNSLSPSTVC